MTTPDKHIAATISVVDDIVILEFDDGNALKGGDPTDVRIVRFNDRQLQEALSRDGTTRIKLDPEDWGAVEHLDQEEP